LGGPFSLKAHVGACLLCLASVASSAEDPGALATALGRRFVAGPGHVGLSIGIIRHGGRRSYHFGSAVRGQPGVPTGRTIYELASLTKSYTGMLLARAVVDGKLALDDDVRRYLPASAAGLAFGGEPVRIRDLASHTSGLPKNLPAFADGATPAALVAQYGGMPRQALLDALAGVHLEAPPGTRYRYSNAGAQLAGLVLERVYGASYDALVQRFITQPLHMPDTGSAPPDVARYAGRYNAKGDAMPALAFWEHLPAAGYLKSTIDDQLAYLAWNLDERDPVVALAHSPTFRHTDERGDAIGLFWFLNRTGAGQRIVRHAGGSFGTTSFALLLPDAQVAVILLANDAGPATEQALAAMADRLAAALQSSSP
jgi:CubicO group peptidase (beta-lactamase class C family)